jgi:hypothetical protein
MNGFIRMQLLSFFIACGVWGLLIATGHGGAASALALGWLIGWGPLHYGALVYRKPVEHS